MVKTALNLQASNEIHSRRAFSLLELLIVGFVTTILVALLLLGLSRARAQIQSASCKSNLQQIGVAAKIYASESGRYPPEAALAGGQLVTWADRLFPNNPSAWTNRFCQCPAYVGQGGLVRIVEPLSRGEILTSFAYNEWGMVDTSRFPRLGLGVARRTAASEPEITAPSEMFAIADSRTFRNESGPYGFVELHGRMQMQPFFYYAEETPPLHLQGYNILFGDGHVALVKRKAYLYPPLAAPHWNRDNQQHPEAWRSTDQWAIQN